MTSIPRILPIFLALGLLFASCQGGGRYADVSIGQAIPEFELPELGGEEVSSQSYLGTPVVLNFWATWCGPCIKEIPTFKAIHRDSPAKVVTIAIDDQGESIVAPFVDKHEIDYTVLIGDKALFRRFNGTGVPYTLILDDSLKVVKMHRGYVSLRTIERDLRRAGTTFGGAES